MVALREWLPVGGKWQHFDRNWDKGLKPSTVKLFTDRFKLYETSRISCFLAHGLPWSDKDRVLGDNAAIFPSCSYPEEWGNDGVAVLNDRTSDIIMFVAPNQVGKTTLAVAKVCLHVCPHEPDAPIFQENGVIWDESMNKDDFRPKNWILASYSWPNVKTLWKRVREVFPREELRQYAPNWGKYEGETGAQKNLTFGDGKPKEVELKCGSTLMFLCYSQSQDPWESFDSDGLLADEQIPYDKWIGWIRSTTTRGDYTPCIMALTGHVLKNRPDTGASSWIKRELWDGRNDQGMKISRYGSSIAATPLAIITEKKRRSLWDRWVNPDIQRSERQFRIGIARYWGGWEESAGLFFGDWRHDVHVIPKMWDDDNQPTGCPQWRVVDHGSVQPTSCVWATCIPSGDLIFHRVYYEPGLSIAEHSRNIIERSGNVQRMTNNEVYDEETGNRYDYYYEDKVREDYEGALLDSRSCEQEQQGQTIREIYARYGLDMIPANGQKNHIQFERVKDWMAIDPSREHIVTGVKGAPRMYIFEDCIDLIDEIESAPASENDPDAIDPKATRHAIDAMKYLISDEPCYHDVTLRTGIVNQKSLASTIPTGY